MGNTSYARVLWIHGPAGFGKTILSARIIEHLKHTETSLAYFFCNSDLEGKRDPLAIVRSWVAQLVFQSRVAYQLAKELVQSAISQTASNSEIWQLFTSIASSIPLCSFIIVVGLDECFQSTDSRTSFLETLRKSINSSTCRVLIVSRAEADVQLSMNSIAQGAGCLLYDYEILEEDVQSDITSFSRSVVDQKLPKKSDALRAELAEKMAEKCSGMFLWIRLQEAQLRSDRCRW